MQLHLDIEGIISGDMLVAALLDALPRFEAGVLAAIDAVDARHPVVCSLLPGREGPLHGSRFKVEPFTRYFGDIPLAFADEVPTVSSLRENLLAAPLAEGTRRHAIRMFQLLSEAESFAQGIPVGAVEFRRIGAWTAMAEIVGAAAIIDSLGLAGWTASAARDFDHMQGTAAAIFRYVCPARAQRMDAPLAESVIARGTGFGSDQAARGSVRVTCFEAGATEVVRLAQSAQRSSSGLSGHQ